MAALLIIGAQEVRAVEQFKSQQLLSLTLVPFQLREETPLAVPVEEVEARSTSIFLLPSLTQEASQSLVAAAAAMEECVSMQAPYSTLQGPFQV